jgi:hypothetical protein
MSRVIWKFPVTTQTVGDDGSCKIAAPTGAEFYSVEIQHGRPVLYAIVDPEATIVTHTVYIFFTGETVPDDILRKKFLGTLMVENGMLVMHFWADRQEG